MPTRSPAVQRLLAELARLCDALGGAIACAWEPDAAAPGRLRIAPADGLAIAVELGDPAIVVRLDGWSHDFVLGGDADDDRAEVDAALDLIGAALFGDVRVLVRTAGSRAHAWTLQVRRDGAWLDASARGGRSYNPFARRGEHLRCNAVARPPAYAPVKVPALPSTPWLGLAGFSVADASDAPAELPIDGELDLHNFSPKEIKGLVLAYLEQCRGRGIRSVRIVHGKGIGNLRRTVHALLERHPHVVGYRLGGHGEGSWGATLVELAPGGE